jgi:hypothetical protein
MSADVIAFDRDERRRAGRCFRVQDIDKDSSRKIDGTRRAMKWAIAAHRRTKLWTTDRCCSPIVCNFSKGEAVRMLKYHRNVGEISGLLSGDLSAWMIP